MKEYLIIIINPYKTITKMIILSMLYYIIENLIKSYFFINHSNILIYNFKNKYSINSSTLNLSLSVLLIVDHWLYYL